MTNRASPRLLCRPFVEPHGGTYNRTQLAVGPVARIQKRAAHSNFLKALRELLESSEGAHG
jgi:hypothetical protein